MVVRSEAAANPLRYTVTKQTTVVDEAGAPVAIERISPGSQLAIQYSGSGEHLVASRIVVQRPVTAVTAPVTTGAAVTNAPVVTEQQTNTTTTTTRPITHAEKHVIHEEKEHRKEAVERQIEHEKDALDKAKDRIEDEDDDD